MKKTQLLIIIFFQFANCVFGQKKVIIATTFTSQYAIKKIKTQYEKETGKKVNVELIIGSSDNLVTQIREGASFDIFISSDMKYPQVLYKDGLTECEPKVYGYGSLVLWTLRDDFDLLNVNVLLLPAVTVIAVVDPEEDPYGEASINVMKYYNLYGKTNPKIFYGKNISDVNKYIRTRSADIGFTAKSIVQNSVMKNRGKWMEIDKKAYNPIAQGAVLLKTSRERDGKDVELFYNYLFFDKAKRIFKKYGYQFPR
jgi:molybdate transport system substrate-binding protein